MRYTWFERLAIWVGSITILATVISSYRVDPIIEEMVAQVLLLAVIVGAVHWGKRGGFLAAIAATGIYIVMRIPLFVEQGSLSNDLIIMIMSRTVMYGVVGILGGELCSRIKYTFAKIEDGANVDSVTKLYNDSSLAKILTQELGKYRRYGTQCSAVAIEIDPNLFVPLRTRRRNSVTKSIANHIRDDVRLVDDVARLADGRFVTLLPNTPYKGAEVVAYRIHSGVCDLLGARDESVTMTVLATPEDVEELETLIASLDTARHSIEGTRQSRITAQP